MQNPEGNFEGRYSPLRSAFTGSVVNAEGKKKRESFVNGGRIVGLS